MRLVAPVAAGVVAGAGVHVAVRSVRPQALAVAAGRLGSSPGKPTSPGTSQSMRLVAKLRLRRLTPQQEQDLAVLGRDPFAHVATRISSSLLYTGAVVLLAVVATVAGVHVVAIAPVLGASVGAAVGYLVPDRRLRRDAKQRRVDVVAALSSYLDLVTVLLAGGAGIETALHAAADSGEGWTYEQLRGALLRARTTRQSVWVCFAELGRLIGVEELVELSASVQLAGQQGARIAQSLGTRAATLRARVLAGIEAEAHAASERMGLPTVLMFVGFLFLLGFPAVRVILGSS